MHSSDTKPLYYFSLGQVTGIWNPAAGIIRGQRLSWFSVRDEDKGEGYRNRTTWAEEPKAGTSPVSGKAWLQPPFKEPYSIVSTVLLQVLTAFFIKSNVSFVGKNDKRSGKPGSIFCCIGSLSVLNLSYFPTFHCTCAFFNTETVTVSVSLLLLCVLLPIMSFH